MAQPGGAPRPPGSAYFEKMHELRQLLRGAAAERDQQKKRDAIKKVIAYMTLGIDVSPLFSEMVMASATTDLVQKKMVYLYLVNYAESNSELAILAINTLQKDCRDDDPMIRGLALRSLCSLSLLNMVEYLQPAVQRALEDVNGYVRKTAVIGVVKVFHLSESAVLDSSLLDLTKRLIHDSDAHVVANAIAALEEILIDEGGLQPTREIVTNLLNRLNQFSEWGQCAVLRLLAKYHVSDEGEMFDIMNILDSLLKQSSSAVVMSVTKIFVDLTSNRPGLQIDVLRRLKAPLLTLIASPTPELSYTVLVHVHALIARGQRHAEVFIPDFKQFFCRYNDPSYIKAVKIDILTLLGDPASADPIVGELIEYVTDVDAEISRRAIRAIGKIAVRMPSTAELIVNSLSGLLELDIDYVSTEAAVVMKDLVRKYPELFQRASGAVERCIKIVAEPEGKCAVLWILGEYGLLIEDAPYLLEPMIDGFVEEQSGSVRLEMLTAALKLFFCRPPEMQRMLGSILEKAIEGTAHPDVRDRALMYYRLLEHSPEEARRVVCAPKEVVDEFQEEMDQEQKDRIFDEFNTLSIVYKQPAVKYVVAKAASFVMTKMQPPPLGANEQEDYPGLGGPSNGAAEAPSMLDGAPAPYAATASASPAAPMADLMDNADLLGGDFSSPSPAPAPAPAASTSAASDLLGMDDLLGGGSPVTVASLAAPPPFSLAVGAMMDSSRFEGLWARLPQLPTQQRQARPVAATTASVEEAARRSGINVVASGQMGEALKFFFFAKQASGPPPPVPGETWFLVELVLAPGSMATANLKADNAGAGAAEQFVAKMWEALGHFVA
eukprot:CAMPEP_0170223240 /NCGR_PEP_ID=MMETSP0116_2-20130129/11318_1 /TAXON_ID=400756 /ORGANISM="Durinskia baltica, Strain CSIRO CS-38" /LENGTH=834 /DNA_ID=CAMNT_0010473939 /DNA_START=28 /DNA_END=2532 /DNA_ORIENTATION=+